MLVRSLSVRDFRNHERAEIALDSGVTVLEGPVGAGKTNLLEALYVGCVGRSFRTANDREMVRFDESTARVSVELTDDSLEHVLEVVIQRSGPKLMRADGARVERPIELEARPLVCVFSPDRLELVKGPAGPRRAHLDEVVAALWPARRETRRSYARALAQRNSLLARIRAGRATASSLSGWTRELACHGAQLTADRAQAAELLAPPFAARATELGLEEIASLRYRPRTDGASAEELETQLEAALAADLDRGFTTHGPHRDELALDLGSRQVRRFGSQGQQRLSLLALLLAERDVLASARRAMPVLLLDDVLSELDDERRGRLLELLACGGQTLVTTADPTAAGGPEGFTRIRVSGGDAAAVERVAA